MKTRVVKREDWYYVEVKTFLFWHTLQKHLELGITVDRCFATREEAIRKAKSLLKGEKSTKIVWESS